LRERYTERSSNAKKNEKNKRRKGTHELPPSEQRCWSNQAWRGGKAAWRRPNQRGGIPSSRSLP